MMVVRHKLSHAWEAEDRRFLANADGARDGWCPELAGIDNAPRPSYIDGG